MLERQMNSKTFSWLPRMYSKATAIAGGHEVVLCAQGHDLAVFAIKTLRENAAKVKHT